MKRLNPRSYVSNILLLNKKTWDTNMSFFHMRVSSQAPLS